jgi:hypothetical protein
LDAGCQGSGATEPRSGARVGLPGLWRWIRSRRSDALPRTNFSHFVPRITASDEPAVHRSLTISASEAVVRESAGLLYKLVVLWAAMKIFSSEVWQEMGIGARR